MDKRNCKDMLAQRLSGNIMGLLKSAGRYAGDMGFRAFVVGGLVRDLFLNRENFDIDIVIEGDGVRFSREFAHGYGASIRCYTRFGTATLAFSDGLKLDIATARAEIYEQPAALPRVLPGSIRDDMCRRDFTINTLAINLDPAHFGELLDFFNGREDIKRKLIRVLHDLSFFDDPTRVFRAVRFEQRFGFRIESSTEKLIKEAVDKNLFDRLADYRISSELKLILKEEEPLRSLGRLKELGILGLIRPRGERSEVIRNLFTDINNRCKTDEP